MLVRDDGDGVLAIGQASHAWLSGQMARAWGGGRFEPPHPYEEVCLAAEQHDVGMAEWDLNPRLQPETGRPQSFMEMSLSDHLNLWERAPSKLLSQSGYAALLVSMHGSALYERRDLSRMTPADADAVRRHLRREREWQQAQMRRLSADPAEVRRNQKLLWTWDALSLAVCLGWPPYVADDVPARSDTTEILRIEPEGAAPARRFRLDPWPFSTGEVRLRCDGRRLATHRDADEMHAALREAPIVALAFTLRPAAG